MVQTLLNENSRIFPYVSLFDHFIILKDRTVTRYVAFERSLHNECTQPYIVTDLSLIQSCSRPVSYLARTPPMPTRLTDSLNSIEDDTDSRLSLSLINPTFLEDTSQSKHKSSLEDLLVPIQPPLDTKSPKTPDKDSLDLELSLRSEITDIPLQTSPATSPSIDSERIRSALDFFEQSLQMDSNDELTGSGEIDLDTIVSSEKGKLEFLTKSRAPRPKGRRPRPQVRTKFRNEPISEDIFIEIAHTAVAGLEDKSCQMQIKQLPPSMNDIKSTKLSFRKSMSADGSGPVTVTKPRNKIRDHQPRPLTEPNLIGPDVPVENKVPIIPPEKPIVPETVEKPIKPVRNVSFKSRPVPPTRKKPTPSTHEPNQTTLPPPKLLSQSCSTPTTDRNPDEEVEKRNEEESTTKSISTPQPRERNVTTPNTAMASVMITALTRIQTDKKDAPPSPPPLPPVKPPFMRDAPPLPSKTHLVPPQRPPCLHPPIEQVKLPPQRPTSPPKGLVQDLPPKPVPPPRIRKENLDKKKDRDSSIIVID